MYLKSPAVGVGTAMQDAHDLEQEYFAKAMDSAEAAEAMAAFMEKREPVFE